MSPSEVVLVKLGGSLITDKSRPESLAGEVLARLAGELVAGLSPGGPRVVLGHGSGSFGHVAARRAGLAGAGLSGAGQSRADQLGAVATGGAEDPASGQGPRPAAAAGISRTQAAAARLHRRVIAALAEAGASPFSLAPSSCLTLDGGDPCCFFSAPLRRALDAGLLPVVYGDVVFDRVGGAAIASTETVLSAVADRLAHHGWRVPRALWLGNTAGVLDDAGAVIPRIRVGADDEALAATGPAAATDVTGGMRHRLESALALARRGVTSWVLDGRVEGLLARALRGEEVEGTRIEPGVG